MQWKHWAINVNVDKSEGPFTFVPVKGWEAGKTTFVTNERHQRIGDKVPEGGTVVALMYDGEQANLERWLHINEERISKVNIYDVDTGAIEEKEGEDKS